MLTRILIWLVVALSATLSAIFTVHEWRNDHRTSMEFKQALQTQQQTIYDANTREARRAIELRKTLQSVEALKKGVTTPGEVVAAIPSYLSLPQPISLTGEPTHYQPTHIFR